jgi:hypothetical protein
MKFVQSVKKSINIICEPTVEALNIKEYGVHGAL